MSDDVKVQGEMEPESAPTSMQDLLETAGYSLKEVKRGDVLAGTILDISEAGILVSVDGIKSEGIISGEDIPNKRTGQLIKDQYLLARDKVRFSGEFFKDSRRLSNFPEMIRSLHNEGFIDSQLFGLLQEIRIISNNAAHGGDITDEQYEFVETIFPIVIGTLKRL